MESMLKKVFCSKFFVLLVVVLVLVVFVFVIWCVDSVLLINDVYVLVDIIDVVLEVSGCIVELVVIDNQVVKQGDLLFCIDLCLYEVNLVKVEVFFVVLDK